MDENARSAQPWDAKQVMYQALVQSALSSADYARELGWPDQIIISCKVSGVQDLITVYRALARRCDYALHLGLTEAGMGTKGTVASATARWPCCCRKASATPSASASRRSPARRARRRWWWRSRSCRPGAAHLQPQRHRLPRLRPHHQHHLPGTGQADRRLPARADAGLARRYPGVENLKVAVMGCIVNGPGESKHADIGISLPGTGEAPAAPVFIDGEKAPDPARRGHRRRSSTSIVENYIEKRRFGRALTLPPGAAARPSRIRGGR
jgi:(E)-4-hydroxy-3-methylbut-2-enyl-diphosphate synthase